MFTSNKIKKLKSRRKLGTSPIIATILLIGLTVVSGAVLYGVTMAFVNTQPNLSLNYEAPSVYQANQNSLFFSDSKINSFSISVTNPDNSQMTVDLARSYVYLVNGTMYNSWSAVSNTSLLLLNGKESAVVTFSTFNVAQEFDIGSQYYVKFAIMTPDNTNAKTITTSTFTIEQKNFKPVYVFEYPTQQSTTQDGNTTYFYANDTTATTVNVTGVLWNYGNPSLSHQKTIQFFVDNSTLFTVDPLFTQPYTVTIPASTTTGDPTGDKVCRAGLACVNISIPVTKNAISAFGNYTHGAYLTITGMDFIPFVLQINNPTIRITLENTNRFNRGFWNWRRNQQCPSFPNWNNYNQMSNTVIFDGSPACADLKTVTFDIWNLQNFASNATIEIIGLNTTVFTLYTSANNQNTGFRNRVTYSDDPQFVSLTAGPGRTYRWFTYCRFPTSQACNTVTWGISRNPMVNSSGDPIGIEAGDYPIIIRDTQTGYQQVFDLYVQPYITTVHVGSLIGSYNKHNRLLTYNIQIVDQDGMGVNRVPITASYTYPNGNGGKTRTTTEYLWSGRNGYTTYWDFNPSKGSHTFFITDLSSNPPTGRWRRYNSMIYIYDSSMDNPNPPMATVNVP